MSTDTGRGYGEGSVYQRADGRWTTSVAPAPGSPAGAAAARSLTGRPKALLRQLRAVEDRLDEGLPVLDARRGKAEFLTYWARQILPGTISDSALVGYRYIVRRGIVPYVGHVLLAAAPGS